MARHGHYKVYHIPKLPRLFQMFPVEVAVILQYHCESRITYFEPTVTFLNLQLIPHKTLHVCQWIYIHFYSADWFGTLWYVMV